MKCLLICTDCIYDETNEKDCPRYLESCKECVFGYTGKCQYLFTKNSPKCRKFNDLQIETECFI